MAPFLPDDFTLAELRDLVATESGLIGSEYHGKTALDPAIRRATARTWIHLTDGINGFGRTTKDLPTIADNERVPVPRDLNNLRRVLRPFSANSNEFRAALYTTEEYWYDSYGSDDFKLPYLPGLYWWKEDSLILRPVPQNGEIVRILYIRKPPPMQADGDIVRLPNGAEEGLIYLAASYIEQNPAKRQNFYERGERALTEIVARYSQRRDQGPDFGHSYIRRSGSTGQRW